MITPDEAKSSESMPLDQVLESAVVINWSDLVRGAVPGLAHVEYHVGAERLIDDVRIWSSTAEATGAWCATARSIPIYRVPCTSETATMMAISAIALCNHETSKRIPPQADRERQLSRSSWATHC